MGQSRKEFDQFPFAYPNQEWDILYDLYLLDRLSSSYLLLLYVQLLSEKIGGTHKIIKIFNINIFGIGTIPIIPCLVQTGYLFIEMLQSFAPFEYIIELVGTSHAEDFFEPNSVIYGLC